MLQNNDLQITVRGLDHETKQALAKQAASHGMSLNRYALQTLRRGAGTDETSNRYKALRAFLAKHPISRGDIQAIDEALAWSDATSVDKQARDERDAGL